MSDRDMLKVIHDDLKEHRKESRAFHAALEQRVRLLENSQNQQKGAIRLLTFLGMPSAGALSAFLTKMIGGF